MNGHLLKLHDCLNYFLKAAERISIRLQTTHIKTISTYFISSISDIFHSTLESTLKSFKDPMHKLFGENEVTLL